MIQSSLFSRNLAGKATSLSIVFILICPIICKSFNEDDLYNGSWIIARHKNNDLFNEVDPYQNDVIPLTDNDAYGPSCDTSKYGDWCLIARTCGKFKKNNLAPSSKYVVNGHQSDAELWPAFVQLLSTNSRRAFCGGVIVSERHILTAKNCVHLINKEDLLIVAGTEFKVELLQGSDQPRVYPGPGYKSFKVKEICSMPSRDQALVTLESSFTFNDYIQPACFSYNHRPQPKMYTEDSRCYVVGIGINIVNADNFPLDESDYVRYKRVLANPTSCAKRTSSICFTNKEQRIQDPSPGLTTCKEDLGGPLICHGPDNQWIVMGTIKEHIKPASSRRDTCYGMGEAVKLSNELATIAQTGQCPSGQVGNSDNDYMFDDVDDSDYYD